MRRHSQKQKQEFQERLASLESQLSEATKAQIELPKSEEEIEIWSKEYPDVAAIIETIAIKKAKEQSEDLQTRMEEINQLQYSAKRKKLKQNFILYIQILKILDLPMIFINGQKNNLNGYKKLYMKMKQMHIQQLGLLIYIKLIEI